MVQQTTTFSHPSFQPEGMRSMISMMAVSGDPEGKLKKVLTVYEDLKQHFFSSSYFPLASMTISDFVDPSQYEAAAQRTCRIYDVMKREPPFLASGEDSVFAALLALSDKSDEQIVQDTEQCYDILKPQFFSGNAVQSLHTITDEREVNILFEILEKRCEINLSTIICSQREPASWSPMILNDEVSANAILKRETKHYTVVIKPRTSA